MIRRKPTRTMWWGEEAQCSKCFGWWPVEKEFFPQIVNGRAHGACRACRLESDPRRIRARSAQQGSSKTTEAQA